MVSFPFLQIVDLEDSGLCCAVLVLSCPVSSVQASPFPWLLEVLQLWPHQPLPLKWFKLARAQGLLMGLVCF